MQASSLSTSEVDLDCFVWTVSLELRTESAVLIRDRGYQGINVCATVIDESFILFRDCTRILVTVVHQIKVHGLSFLLNCQSLNPLQLRDHDISCILTSET